jgi:hypothetical protein
MDVAEGQSADSLAMDDALRRLAAFDERKSRAIELKYYGGMTTEEIGIVLGISVATVGRELRLGQIDNAHSPAVQLAHQTIRADLALLPGRKAKHMYWCSRNSFSSVMF